MGIFRHFQPPWPPPPPGAQVHWLRRNRAEPRRACRGMRCGVVDELLGMSSGMGRGIAKNNDLDVLLEVRING